MNDFEKYENETYGDYEDRIIYSCKKDGMTWQEIADILNIKTGQKLSADGYRSRYRRRYLDRLYSEQHNEEVKDGETSTLDEKLDELKRERIKLSDERIQNNAYIRRLAREETLKEIAENYANKLNVIAPFNNRACVVDNINNRKEATLLLSDWHYGIEINNYWNIYNKEVFEERLRTLLNGVISVCKNERIDKINVLNLGDLICGRIHLTLRLQSREDIITQLMDISEYLGSFLEVLSNTVKEVHYYDCLDNHSRVEPNAKDSLDLESMVRLIPWYLRSRLKDVKNVILHNNEYDPDIITLKVLDKFEVAAVHGHKDPPGRVVHNVTMMTRKSYDLVCCAHYHHFSADELNEAVLVSNGSLMGTDNYAKNARLTARPSQMLIISDETDPIAQLRRIVLD